MTAIRDTTVVEQTMSCSKRRSLHEAKNRFMESVSNGVEELMNKCGYSRERATGALVRELGRVGQACPTDDEVFHMMTVHGIGMSAAEQCLVVSKAVRKLMKDEGMSAIDAIDDLSSRLSVSNLYSSSSNDHQSEEATAKNSQHRRGHVQQVKATPSRTVPVTASAALERQPSLGRKVPTSSRKSSRKGKAKTEGGGKNTKNGRKRAMTSGSDESTQGEPPKTRARADSVTEVVNAKIADRPTSPSATGGRPPSARGKRAALHDSQQPTASQPTLKRQRTNDH